MPMPSPLAMCSSCSSAQLKSTSRTGTRQLQVRSTRIHGQATRDRAKQSLVSSDSVMSRKFWPMICPSNCVYARTNSCSGNIKRCACLRSPCLASFANSFMTCYELFSFFFFGQTPFLKTFHGWSSFFYALYLSFPSLSRV